MTPCIFDFGMASWGWLCNIAMSESNGRKVFVKKNNVSDQGTTKKKRKRYQARLQLRVIKQTSGVKNLYELKLLKYW